MADPKPKQAKRKFIVDWRVEGSLEVMATSVEEAQAIFDRQAENGRIVGSHGEWSNDKPYEDPANG